MLLLVAVVVMGKTLSDLRKRLAALEARMNGAAPLASPPREASARIVPQVRKPAVIISDAPQSMTDAGVTNAPEPEPEPEAVALVSAEPPPVSAPSFDEGPKSPRPATRRIGFEDLFGRKLPIWAGGITLAIAGVLLVKYSIDAGLLSPAVRVLIGFGFGFALIGGAEAARRGEARIDDPRVAQALSGAGIASLYAAILAAVSLYHLLGPTAAFVGLALVTALAMALSVRFGAPSALLGLAGGLAAPALVGEGPPNIPLLSAYLALAIGGLTALSRRQRWMWLGTGALLGGAGWGGLLILTGALDAVSSLSLGLLAMLIGLGLPMLVFGGVRAGLFRFIAAVAAAAQIALLVARGGFAPLQWGLYLLLAGGLGWLAWREKSLRSLPPVGLAVGLLLTMVWPDPPPAQLAVVLVLLGVLHVGPAWLRLWRADGGLVEAGQIAGFALVGHGVAWGQLSQWGDAWLALLACVAAVLPGAAAAQGWRRPERTTDARFALLALAAGIMLGEAAYLALASWLLPVALAALAAGLAMTAWRAADRWLGYGTRAYLGALVISLVATDFQLMETARLAGEAGGASMAQALLRWAATALALGVGAWRGASRARPAVAALAALIAYGAAAQVAPGWSLPVIAALGMLAAVEGGRRVDGFRPLALVATFGAIALLWALHPLAEWGGPALASVAGRPMLADGLPGLLDALTRLATPVALAAVALGRTKGDAPRLRRAAFIATGVIGVVAAHSLYKHLFHIRDAVRLIALGLAERTLWEALLIGAAVLLWRWRGWTGAGAVFALAALLHALWFSLLLFNPLTTAVAVGAWPVANLLLPAFAAPMAALWMIERTVPPGWTVVVRVGHVLHMILIALFALMALRQMFAGALLVGPPVGSAENIGRSVLAIALALGFLVWGIRSGRHDWRIGSLVLMLTAVAKVFLLDAAGLEGLLRIASFLALGFSLIGIGWLYSRFLRKEAA